MAESNGNEGSRGLWMVVRTFKDLIVWQKAYDLVRLVYKSTKDFPTEERFGLVSQIRRAAISLPSNIAEGYARRYLRQYIQFLCVSYGSGAELETQLMLAKDLGYLEDGEFIEIMAKYNEVERMLAALIRSLEQKT